MVNGLGYIVNWTGILRVIKEVLEKEKTSEIVLLNSCFEDIKDKSKEEFPIGFGIMKKYRNKTQSKEDTMIILDTFKLISSQIQEHRTCFYRSVNIEGSITKNDKIEQLCKLLPSEFLKEKIVICGYPQFIWSILDIKSKKCI